MGGRDPGEALALRMAVTALQHVATDEGRFAEYCFWLLRDGQDRPLGADRQFVSQLTPVMGVQACQKAVEALMSLGYD